MSMLRHFMALSTWVRVLVAFLFVWGLLVFIFASKLNAPLLPADSAGHALQRLNQAVAYLEQSKQKNAELRELIDELLSDKSLRPEHRQKLIADIQNQLLAQSTSRFGQHDGGAGGGGTAGEPSLEYEQLRRRVYSNTQEMWRFVQHEVQQLRTAVGSALAGGHGGVGAKAAPITDDKLNRQFDDMLALAAEHKSSLLNDMNQMREVDGYESWRHRESRELSDLVQRRLTALQNPENCDTAQKLVCRLNKVIAHGLSFIMLVHQLFGH